MESTGITNLVAVAVQPFWLAVTEKVVPTDGFTEIVAFVSPVFHKYDVPPDAVSVAPPIHVVLIPTISAFGVGFTTSVMVVEP